MHPHQGLEEEGVGQILRLFPFAAHGDGPGERLADLGLLLRRDPLQDRRDIAFGERGLRVDDHEAIQRVAVAPGERR